MSPSAASNFLIKDLKFSKQCFSKQPKKLVYQRAMNFNFEGLGFLTRAEIVGEEIGPIGKPDFVMKTPEGRTGLIAEGKAPSTCSDPT